MLPILGLLLIQTVQATPIKVVKALGARLERHVKPRLFAHVEGGDDSQQAWLLLDNEGRQGVGLQHRFDFVSGKVTPMVPIETRVSGTLAYGVGSTLQGEELPKGTISGTRIHAFPIFLRSDTLVAALGTNIYLPPRATGISTAHGVYQLDLTGKRLTSTRLFEQSAVISEADGRGFAALETASSKAGPRLKRAGYTLRFLDKRYKTKGKTAFAAQGGRPLLIRADANAVCLVERSSKGTVDILVIHRATHRLRRTETPWKFDQNGWGRFAMLGDRWVLFKTAKGDAKRGIVFALQACDLRTGRLTSFPSVNLIGRSPSGKVLLIGDDARGEALIVAPRN